jgi:SAM-dependent methyltransferase
MARSTTLRSRVGGLTRRLPKEPPIEPDYLDWRRFYEDREHHYATFADELGDHPDDGYLEWYRRGGYGYDPRESRLWLCDHTSLPDFRGTCLDVGSGDGFWSVLLSEWYHVYGVDPSPGGIELANAIKKRLPSKIADRIDCFRGDALEVTERYDVVFCRAPSFFNYPAEGRFDNSMYDWDRSNLRQVFEAENPETADQRVREYPRFSLGDGHEPYAGEFRSNLERMLAATKKLFVFIISSHPLMYGKYYGDTYAHDPASIDRVFGDYGRSSVKVVSNYIVAEIRDPRIPDPPPSEAVPQRARA